MATIRAKWGNWAALGVLLPHARELAIVVAAYWAYMYTRSLVFNDAGATALNNAEAIISLERSLGFFWEPQWQEWTLSVFKALVLFFNWAYIVTFWPILLVTGVILYVINRQRYRYYRNLVLLSFVFALLGFHAVPPGPASHDVRSVRGHHKGVWAGLLRQPRVRQLLQSLRRHAQLALQLDLDVRHSVHADAQPVD